MGKKKKIAPPTKQRSKEMKTALELLESIGKPYIIILLDDDSMLKESSKDNVVEFESNVIDDMVMVLLQKVGMQMQANQGMIRR